MLLIDQGEKKLIRREILDEAGNQIPFSDITEFTFDLIRRGLVRYTFTLSAGQVLEYDTGVKVEFSSNETEDWVPGTYDLRATIQVNDDRFPTESTEDIQTEQNFCEV